jgi:hypothetical protein
MARELVEKAGPRMAENPAPEGERLAPVRSQGAVGIAGRGLDTGHGFVARPGERRAIRRGAFVMAGEALDTKGRACAVPAAILPDLANRWGVCMRCRAAASNIRRHARCPGHERIKKLRARAKR